MFDSIILVNIMVIGLQVNFSGWGKLKKIWGKQEEKAKGDHKHDSFYLGVFCSKTSLSLSFDLGI